MILVYQHPQFKGNPSVKYTQAYVRIEFGKYQLSSKFFRLTREHPFIIVNDPYNICKISDLGFSIFVFRPGYSLVELVNMEWKIGYWSGIEKNNLGWGNPEF
ncbi:UDP-N-acetylglucosamine 2-epimerase [Trichinella spiralis]|uniref:UDP-N-acetylglucosamine 2-epimerase n=1 Tax=Trichinella spiralis TaxID=6334 RepID=UPI0001EFD4C1|nr:UDP-N-acetylglucosamine 2-epimerase [Trichinella spiralis]